jgi:microcystin-dependent protein
MPRDSNGNYSLASGYKATPGETILASQHNPPLEDLASAMTGSLPRDGSAPMGGPLRTVTGSAGSPAISPNGNPTVGIYFTATGVAFAGTVTGTRYIGELIPYTFLTPEPLTVLPYGQTLLRASYPELWAKAQTDIAAGNQFYNNGNGTTTFGIGDLRGRVIAGKDNMGGAAAGRLTSASSGVDGATLGASGGAQNISLTASQLAQHVHSGTTGGMNGNNPHSHSASGVAGDTTAVPGVQGGSTYINSNVGHVGIVIGYSDINHGHPFTTDGGSGLAGAPHNNAQPTFVCNYLLYAGA